jgi:glycosyltransferase involved in cell wall biosynthesis
MRLIYFSRDYSVHDHRFLDRLARTGHTVGFLALENRPTVQFDRPLPAEIEWLQWAGGRGPVQLQDGWRLLRSLRQVINSFKPDLVQAGPIQTAAFLTALSGFRPFVSTSWGYDLLIDANRSPAWRAATRYTLRRSAAMVGDCNAIRQQAIAYGMDPEKIVTFPWGVDLQHFTPGTETELRARLGWNPQDFIVISTRGWAPIYGIEELARGFAAAAQELPQLRLLMLGNGPQASLIRKVFMQADVLDYVHFPGQVSQESLPRYYRAADLYLSASHSDGSSISLLEALACGRPALVSDIPGNREWVNPGEQGWWFQTGSAAELTRQLLEAVAQRDRLAEMGRWARQTAEARANWETNFSHLLDAYQLALQP